MVEDVLVKVRPIKRVRSLFTVEDIKVDGDDLEIENLIDTIPTTDEGLAELKQYVLSNPLISGVIVSLAGEAVIRFPATVARLRIWGAPTSQHACASGRPRSTISLLPTT